MVMFLQIVAVVDETDDLESQRRSPPDLPDDHVGRLAGADEQHPLGHIRRPSRLPLVRHAAREAHSDRERGRGQPSGYDHRPRHRVGPSFGEERPYDRPYEKDGYRHNARLTDAHGLAQTHIATEHPVGSGQPIGNQWTTTAMTANTPKPTVQACQFGSTWK